MASAAAAAGSLGVGNWRQNRPIQPPGGRRRHSITTITTCPPSGLLSAHDHADSSRQASIESPSGGPGTSYPLSAQNSGSGHLRSSGISANNDLQRKGHRRQSIQESFQNITKSMSNSIAKAMNRVGSTSSLHHLQMEEGKSKLHKHFFKELLASHFNQTDLKVTKMDLQSISTPNTQDSSASGNSYSSTSTMHKPIAVFVAEVCVKDNLFGNGKRKLNLVVKYCSNVNPAILMTSHVATSSDNVAQVETAEPLKDISEEDGEKDEQCSCMGLDARSDTCSITLEREWKTYSLVVKDLCRYLKCDKSILQPLQYLPLPESYFEDSLSSLPTNGGLSDVLECSTSLGSENPSPCYSPRKSIFDETLVLEDIFSKGYHCVQHERADEGDLDFNHCIMAISRMARMHGVSYAMFREENIDVTKKYPFLASDPIYRPETAENFTKLQSKLAVRMAQVFQHAPQELRDFSPFFIESVQNFHSLQSKYVAFDGASTNGDFNVLCHGELWRQNVLFYYGTSLEALSDCVDVRFENLHRSRYSSCVTDFLYFLFTTVDADVRKDHMIDFLGAYYDNFAKMVDSISPGLKIFTREDLFHEFKRKMMYGFLESAALHTTAYETQLKRSKDSEAALRNLNERKPSVASALLNLEDAGPRLFADYRDSILAMVSDMVRIKFQGNTNVYRLDD